MGTVLQQNLNLDYYKYTDIIIKFKKTIFQNKICLFQKRFFSFTNY